jgi:hypothetical protein
VDSIHDPDPTIPSPPQRGRDASGDRGADQGLGHRSFSATDEAWLRIATDIYPSANTIPYPYPSRKFIPVELPIYAHGYKILPVSARIILPVGKPIPARKV